jgi:hypothetical protein
MSEFIPFPDKEYNVIYADPPWRYSDRGCNGNEIPGGGFVHDQRPGKVGRTENGIGGKTR